MHRSGENGNQHTASHQEAFGNPEAGIYDRVERTCNDCGQQYEVGFPQGTRPPPDLGTCAACRNKDQIKKAAEQMKNWPSVDEVYGKKK
ncbi:MAG: hypothetical protein WCT27_01930 [Patescibacteria group bacterium]|jgi:hypothetical protein